MSQDEISENVFDEQLTRLFAEKNEVLPSHEFLQQVLLRLQREYRMRWIRRSVFAVGWVMLAGAVAPWVARATVGVFSAVGQVTQLPSVDVVIAAGMVLVAVAIFFRARRWA